MYYNIVLCVVKYIDPYIFFNGGYIQFKIFDHEQRPFLHSVLKNQCLGSGSGSGSVGSARFWLPGSGSGSAKICGSTAKYQPKTSKKTFTPKSELLKKERF